MSSRKPLGPRGVAVASLVGTTIEFYDFYVYATTVVLALGPLFFPSDSGLMSALIAFSTVGVGFFARPIGGLVFAHFGDRVGRKRTLVVSLMLMGVATVAVGLLPTYEQVGVLAPILLVTARFIQGVAVGGEWGGAVLLAVEHAPPGKRGIYGAFPQFGSPLGVLASSGVIALFMMLPGDAYLTWGWRVPFLLSIVLVAVGLVMRSRIEESVDLEQAAQRAESSEVPVATVLRHHWRAVVVGVMLTSISHALLIILAFLPSYAVANHAVDASLASQSLVIASAFATLALVLVVRNLDEHRRPMLARIGAVAVIVWAFPAFVLTQQFGALGMILATTIGYVMVIGHYGALPSLLTDLFPTHVGYTGITLSYQVSAVLFGGLLPIVTTYLVSATGGGYWPAAVLFMMTGVLTYVAVGRLRPVSVAAPRHASAAR